MRRYKRGLRGAVGLAIPNPSEANSKYAVGAAAGFGLAFVADKFLPLPDMVKKVLAPVVGLGVAFATPNRKLGLGLVAGGALHAGLGAAGLLPGGAAELPAGTAGWGAYVAEQNGIGAYVAEAMNGVGRLSNGVQVDGLGQYGDPSKSIEIGSIFGGPFGNPFASRT